MPNPGLSEALARETYEAVRRYRSVTLAADALKINRNTFSNRYQSACRLLGLPKLEIDLSRRPLVGDKPRPAVDWEVARVTQRLGPDGSVQAEYVRSEPPRGEAFEPLPGHAIKGESALVDASGRVMQRWIKTREGSIGAGLVEALQAAFEGFRGLAVAPPPPPASVSDLLTLYPLPDLHFGMYSWGKETGADYDIEIATSVALSGISGLVAQSRPTKKAVLLGVGDYFHNDDAKQVTPGSGHKLDVDGRWRKVFEHGARLFVQLIQIILTKHEEVEVVVLPGNHDPNAAIALAVALEMLFENVPGVTVTGGQGLVWYRRHGAVLLGATHGHTMKPDRMAMMLATDRPEDWGATQYRHFFFGHVHHESVKEVGPVRVESFSTPAGRDAYAAGAGYRSGRALNAITFCARAGEVGRHRVNIAAGKPRVRRKAA